MILLSFTTAGASGGAKMKYLAVTRVSTPVKNLARSTRWPPSPSCGTVDTTSLTIRGGIAGEGRKDWGGSDDKWTDDDPAAAMIGSILVPNGSFDDHVTTNGRVRGRRFQ